MIRHEHNGLAYYTFASLDAYPELRHAISTRHGGISTGHFASLNLTTARGDTRVAVEENLARLCAALGLRRDHLVSPNQCHSANVRRVGSEDRGQVYTGYDIFITNDLDVLLLLRFADCTPVLIYDPVRGTLALIHSGWRGTVLGAPRAAVQALEKEFGSRPEDLVAAIGPSIGPCCYEVGQEVAGAVRATFREPDRLLPKQPGGRLHFDLWAANQQWLAEAGLRQVEVAGICTACRTDDFYSHRAEAGKTGHFGALMALCG